MIVRRRSRSRNLARLSASRYAEDFVLKGGMLLAAYDAFARSLVNDQETVVVRIAEIADEAVDDGDGQPLRDRGRAAPARR